MKKKFILPILLVVLLVIAFCYYKYSHNATWQLVEIEMTDDEILKEMPDIALTEADHALENFVVALPEVQEAVKKSSNSESIEVISSKELASLLQEWISPDRTVTELTVSGNAIFLGFNEGEYKKVYYTFSADGSYQMRKTIGIYEKSDDEIKCKALYETDSEKYKKYVNKRKWF